jgi:hypothetical protein
MLTFCTIITLVEDLKEFDVLRFSICAGKFSQICESWSEVHANNFGPIELDYSTSSYWCF